MEITTISSGGIKTFISQALERFRWNRIEKLLEALKSGGISINDEAVQDDNFVSALINASDAIQKSSGRLKIDILIEIFVNGVKSQAIKNNSDIFHEVIISVSALSERELLTLSLCGEILTYSSEEDGRLIIKKCGELYEKISETLKISQGGAIAIVCGLQRSGFIVPINQPQAYPIYTLSEKYKDLRSYIHLSSQFM
ncbi:hypothetical protein ACJJIR_16405 [Microbulbifer sp. SSSA008]|uniref:hypothetical protein n=1 Tax=Microbulbifer sp. SSSA008 TaxID=3243380 RepID=UPI00403A655F